MLDFKTQNSLKMKNRATTYADDSRNDSEVRYYEDIDDLMHLKIAVVELFKRQLSWLDQVLQIDEILQDLTDDVQYDDNDVVESEKKNTYNNSDETV